MNTLRTILLFFMMLISNSVCADTVCINNIYYDLDSETRTATVTYRKVFESYYSGIVTIPRHVEYEGIRYTVTTIGFAAFWECKNLQTVEMPFSIKKIDIDAFCKSGITSIEIPTSVDVIEDCAFIECENLTSITLKGVKRIGNAAFMDCTKLQEAWIYGQLEEMGRKVFWRCDQLRSVRLPEKLIVIGDSAFADCRNLVSINIPSGASIGIGAFDGCSNLATKNHNLASLDNTRKGNDEKKSDNNKRAPNSTIIPIQSKMSNDVDKSIPVNPINRKNSFAVILGNEKYEDETDVPFAENDAKIFKDYCRQTLGISENHIRFVTNAGYNDIRKATNWLRQGLEAYSGEGSVIFYYAGHGIPDEAEKTAYLLPVDGIGSDVGSAYSLEKLYQALGDMPAKSIIVFLDACFSGAKRDGGMMASARGVAIKTKAEEPKGKMVVFTAAQGDETAYPYKSQQHGMFTYYLLRKLQETKGDVTLGELADYITREVKRQSFDENSRSQTPTVNASASISSIWRNMKLK